MEALQREFRNPGVLMIGFKPVVREGLEAILNKDKEIEALHYIRRARKLGDGPST